MGAGVVDMALDQEDKMGVEREGRKGGRRKAKSSKGEVGEVRDKGERLWAEQRVFEGDLLTNRNLRLIS